jgi:hypothetical protein
MRRWSTTSSQHPKRLRLGRTRLDNIALVPASELASLEDWKKRARLLPPGATLLVISRNNPQLRRVGKQIAVSLRRQGRTTHLATPRSR